MHVWYSHRYAYSPLVTEPNDYGKSVFGWQWSTAVYLMKTRILKISIKNFKGFRNVRKSIETSDDISVAT